MLDSRRRFPRTGCKAIIAPRASNSPYTPPPGDGIETFSFFFFFETVFFFLRLYRGYFNILNDGRTLLHRCGRSKVTPLDRRRIFRTISFGFRLVPRRSVRGNDIGSTVMMISCNQRINDTCTYCDFDVQRREEAFKMSKNMLHFQ